MSALPKDYGAIITPNEAFLYFVFAVIITLILLGLLFFIVRCNIQDNRNGF